MSLRNRVALVTGGSRGIGRGLALRLAQDGARIAIAYRSNKVAAQQTLRQLQASGADCVAVETDITDAGRCDQLIKTVVDRFGRLDVIVNSEFGKPKMSAYASAKAAVVALSSTLEHEEDKNGITLKVVIHSSID